MDDTIIAYPVEKIKELADSIGYTGNEANAFVHGFIAGFKERMKEDTFNYTPPTSGIFKVSALFNGQTKSYTVELEDDKSYTLDEIEKLSVGAE